jgi:hypothetical protein
MKNIFILLALSLVMTACGQNRSAIKTGAEVFNSKYVRMISDTNVMMLIENVEVAYGDFYTKADSVLLDKPQKTITVYGARNATFKGEAITEKGNVIRYTKGDGRYYAD